MLRISALPSATRPPAIATRLKLYEAHGKPPRRRCLGAPLCYLKAETGDPNPYPRIRVYDSAAGREAKRAKLRADPDWLAYTRKSAELGALVSQETKLMNPLGCCPLVAKG